MANEITSIKIGNVEYPIDFSKHTHSQYATLEQLNESELATAEALNDLDTKLDGKSESDHIHDERYYTETEVNNLLAGKANSSHTHGNDLPVKLINAPSIATLQTYGLPSDYTSTRNRAEYFKAFLKYLLATAPGYTCVGYLSPSSRGSYICDVYNNGLNSETGLPEHITGHYFQHAGTHTAFGTSYGNYYEYEYLNSNNFSGYAAIKNHTHSYLPLSGGTMTGTINSQSIIPVTTHNSSSTGYSLGSSTKQFNTVYSRYIDTVSGFNLRLRSGGVEHLNMVSGNVNSTANIIPTANNTYSLGTSTYNWKNIYGVNFIQNGVNIKDIYPDAKYADFCASYLHSPNRAQFCRPSGVTIEYSTDSGTTWIDYGATNEQKVGFFSGFSQNFILGKGISTKSLPSDMLRITMDATEMGFYTSCKSLLINISTNGSNNFRVKVEKSMKGTVDTFTTLIESQTLTGWSGWNRIPIGYSFGGGATQTYNIAKIRLTFMSDGASSSYTSGAHPYVIDMEVLGNTYWAVPHTMAKTGHIYEWDVNGNAIFLNDINISKGSDLTLQASSSTPTDPGDLVFANSSGTELGCIWLNGSTFSLRYGTNDTAKTIIHSGNIGSYAALPNHSHNFTWNNNDTNLETILGNLQAQITANATAIQNKSDKHDHNYISSTTTRTKNTVLAGPTTGSNAAPTFRALVAADIPDLSSNYISSTTTRTKNTVLAGPTTGSNAAPTFRTLVDADIPNLNANKITSGTLNVDRIPTGTTSTTVAFGDHTHSEYATVEQLNESELATAEALNDLDTRVDALESNPGGTFVTDDDQEWSGVKTFLSGIRIGDDADPGSLESNRTIYFGDGSYTYITEVPSDQLALKGNRINLNASNTLTNKAIFPETTNYKPISLPSTYSASSTRYSSGISFGRHCTQQTFATVEESSYNIYIQGTNEYYGIGVSAGYTVEINVGAAYTAYRDTLWIDSGYACPECDNLIEFTVQPYLDSTSGYHCIRYYLTESSSSTTPISGTVVDIYAEVDGYTSLNPHTASGSSTYVSHTTTIKYTNTSSSYKTVYLKGKILRPASRSITISSPESGYWRYTIEEGSDIGPSSWYVYPVCEYCGTSFTSNTRALMWASIGSGKTFYTYFKNVTTYYKYATYKENTKFSLPSLDMSAYGPVSVLGNGIVSGTGATFDNANLASSDKGLINTTTQLCYKFADAMSGFLVDSNQLSYISGASTDVSICPSRIFDITSGNGLTFAQGNSKVSPEYMFNTKNGKITLGYYSGSSNYSVEFDFYKIITPGRSGSFTLGSSSNRLGTIYSTAAINTSDERFKNWISDIDVDFEKLKKIPKKLFTWRDSFLKDDDDIHIGTSAQVIRDIYPEIVHVYNSDVDFCPPRDIYDPDAVLAIEYDKLGVIALAAVDKLHEENVQLKEENEQLKLRLDNLEAILKEKGIL